MLNKQEIDTTGSEIAALVHENRLKEALDKLSGLLDGIHNADYTLEFENLDQTYRMLLEYSFRGVPDPQRNRIFQSLKVSVLELTDLVLQKSLANTGMHIYSLKSRVERDRESAREEVARTFDKLPFEKELARLLHENDVVGSEVNTDLPHISPRLFSLIWLTEKYHEPDLQLIQAIRTSGEVPWYEKCMVVSAVTLSLINCFDKEKFLVLADFYDDQEEQVWQRALTGLVMAVYYYSDRMDLYPVITDRLDSCQENPGFYDHLRIILIQVFKAKETEKLTSRFKDEILPDVQKFESKLKEKLDLDNLLANDLIEDKNPDWEKIFEDSPDLLGKIEKMSEMQMEGLDLFMGTFAMLKSFDFFRELSNWFRPFYKENEFARKAVEQEPDMQDAFLAGMETSFYMCNSDKYSFCFNISHLPGEHARKIMGLFNLEAENIQDMLAEDKILNKPEREVYVFTQYIQDLYRFFKLHPFRNDFRDLFNLEWDIAGTRIFEMLKPAPGVLLHAGQFLFEKEHYREAIRIYEYLAGLENPDQAIIEKLAYCYQLLGDYEQALKNYKKAEIFESNRLWSVKKIVYCYRKLNDNQSALDWCSEAFALSPDDVYLHTMAGNCYLDMKMYREALDHYFRVEFLAPDNIKVLRPIAWCCFVLNELEMARNYMKTVLENDPGSHDYINAGHVELCHFNKIKAIEYYRKALVDGSISLSRLKEILDADKEFLISNGISPDEIPMITDYLRY